MNGLDGDGDHNIIDEDEVRLDKFIYNIMHTDY